MLRLGALQVPFLAAVARTEPRDHLQLLLYERNHVCGEDGIP